MGTHMMEFVAPCVTMRYHSNVKFLLFVKTSPIRPCFMQIPLSEEDEQVHP